MDRQEVKEMVMQMGVTFDDTHPDHIDISNIEQLTPPFLEYTLTDAPVYADGIRYLDIKRLVITLYSDDEESEAEAMIEAVLTDEDLRWRKNREFIEDILMWNITYTLEV